MTEKIESWFLERPRWLQSAVGLRLTKGHLDESDYENLAALCRKEAGEVGLPDEFKAIPHGVLDQEPETAALRLKSIHSLSGINALKPARPLVFSDTPITIVYGANGSGKSGYSRLLRHACGLRVAGELHGDAFDSTATEQKATFDLQVGLEEQTHHWKRKNGPVSALRRIHVFDSDRATSYVARANEPTHEPFILRLFSQVISDCARVESVLRLHQGRHPSSLPLFPEALKEGTRYVWFQKLSADTTLTSIEANCAFSSDDEAELRRIDAELNATDPQEAIAELKRKRSGIEPLVRELERLEAALSPQVGETIRSLRSSATTRRDDATTRARELFASAPLSGIGEKAWRRMWEAAREYSERIAYPGRPFPVVADESPCVLCQQPLREGAARLTDFERFVRDALEEAAEGAERTLASQLDAVPAIPDLVGLAARFEATGNYRIDVAALHGNLQQRRAWVLGDSSDPAPSLGIERFTDELRGRANYYSTEIERLETLERDEERKKAVARLRDLKARQWLSQQRKSIESEISRRKTLAQLDEAIALTNTHALTRKKNDLSEELLAAGHEARFVAELTALGGTSIPIRLQHHRAEKADRPGFGVALKDPQRSIPVPDVLSEGESRVVALASFLADVTGGPSNAPFIFDDPISSLDQDFEEATARRLVKEAGMRQVIIFTHRLSLLASVFEAADKASTEYSVTALRSVEGKGTPGESYIREKNPISALKNLRNDRLAKARNARDVGDYGLLEALTKALCGDLRILVERLVEKVLLNGVVERFRRSVQTKDKLQKLASIKPEDCAFLDELMTTYSFEEHSQPNEAPVPLPTLERVSTDLDRLIEWATQFEKRA